MQQPPFPGASSGSRRREDAPAADHTDPATDGRTGTFTIPPGSQSGYPPAVGSAGLPMSREPTSGTALGAGHQSLSVAGQRGYADKLRSMADIDTEKLLSLPSGSPPRRAARAVPLWHQSWVRGLLLVALLALLALRAGLASANFMAPGGAIVGWSQVGRTTSPFTQVTPPPTTHQLTPSEYGALLTQQLNIDQEIGQLITVELRGRNPGPDENQMINGQGAGGVLFFANNIQSAPQVKASTSQMQQWAPIPLLMSVDQEGGMVDRFKAIVGPQPSAWMLAQQGPAAAQAQGMKDALTLHQYGFNLNLAPVVDVGYANPQLVNPNYPHYGRTFSDDPRQVATMAGAYLSGLQADGTVTATLKHYPGLGATNIDPHRGLPVLSRSRADWEAIDLLPYRKLLASQDVRSIMVTHVMVPAVDPDLPSSISPSIIDGVLRQELGFQGVVITDDVFNMEALSARYPGPQAAVMAIEAGADEIIGPYSPQTVQATRDAIKQAMASGSLTKDRIDLSVQRILTLKIQMGLIPLPKAESTPAASPSPKPGGDVPAGPVAYRSPSAGPRS